MKATSKYLNRAGVRLVAASFADRALFATNSHVVSIKSQRSVSTIHDKEVAHFKKLASSWWQEGGSMSLLKNMNQLRVPLAVDALATGLRTATHAYEPLQGKLVLDVGCGGGFLSEALATLGAQVVGIDACSDSVVIAREHARATLSTSVSERLTYVAGSVEQLEEATKCSADSPSKLRVEHGKAKFNNVQFDLVIASEIIEHVLHLPEFVRACASLTKPGGSLIFTTINRTLASLVLAKWLAEYVLELLPRGTHSWDRFVTPHELGRLLDRAGCDVHAVRGMQYDVIRSKWTWTSHTLMNYALHAVKRP